MPDVALVGTWRWGPSKLESFRIGSTWCGGLGLWSEGHGGETIFGLLQSTGQWHRTELLYDGRKTGIVMRFRALPSGNLSFCIQFPDNKTIENLASKVSSPSKPATRIPRFEQVELELDLVRVGGLGVRAWHRPTGAPRAPFAVVICPGIGADLHGGSRLAMELETVLAERHVPVVVFDYGGQGASSAPVGGSRLEPARWQAPAFNQATKDTEAILDWTKEYVSDSLVLCGLSWGCASALQAALATHVDAFVSISVGCLLPRSLPPETPTKEIIPWTTHMHSSLTCKALYICGDEDSFTPMEEVQRLVRARSDEGADASVEVVRSKDHALFGCEEEVASLCADWIQSVREEIGSRGSMTVHVACQQCANRRSVDRRFHTNLPTGAVIGDLRRALGCSLPKSAKVLDAEDLRVLRDTDLVPPRVNVSQYEGEITSAMVLTKDQCRKAQELIKAAAEDPDMQKRLDDLQKKSKWSEQKYRRALASILVAEVFPNVAREFHLPPSTDGMRSILGALEAHGLGDPELLRLLLEAETREKSQVQIVKEHRKIAGLEQMGAAVGVA